MKNRTDWDYFVKQGFIDKIKDNLCDLKLKFLIYLNVISGYIDRNGEPLKCDNCKSKDLEEYDVYNLDGFGTCMTEYSVKCKNAESI